MKQSNLAPRLERLEKRGERGDYLSHDELGDTEEQEAYVGTYSVSGNTLTTENADGTTLAFSLFRLLRFRAPSYGLSGSGLQT